MANRAWTLFKSGMLEEARQQMQSIVARLREALDDSHIVVRTYSADLAEMEREAGNPKGAATELEELHAASLREFGRGHKNTISIGIKFARALAACGDMARAIELQVEIALFARQHDRLRFEAGVDAAGLFLATQDTEKALGVMEVLAVMSGAESAFGPHHPITTQAAFNKWRCLSQMDRSDEAALVFSQYLSWLTTADPATLGLTRHRILRALTAEA